jgi:hypothetical protein
MGLGKVMVLEVWSNRLIASGMMGSHARELVVGWWFWRLDNARWRLMEFVS